MDEFVVIVFPDEASSYKGIRALEELHEEGSVTLYGTAVVQRTDKELLIKQQNDRGPLGFGIGALLGGLVGMIAGPAGAISGFAAGGLAGGFGDFLRAEVTDEFLETIEVELKPGKYAVIAELWEDWVAPVNTRMAELGGTVIREFREDFVADLLEKRSSSRKAELARRKAERAGVKAERLSAKLDDEIRDVQERLQKTAEKARKRLDQAEEELNAKIAALVEQTAKATPEVKTRIEDRISELRKDFSVREQKLKRAYDLAQDALA